jgi:hypothetical protein
MVNLEVQQHVHEFLAPEANHKHSTCSLSISYSRSTKDITLQELFNQNAAAKIWRVAQRDLENNVSLIFIFLSEQSLT